MPKQQITNLHMTHTGSTIAVGWEVGAKRYHVWIEDNKGEPVRPYRAEPRGHHGPVLYLNPLRDIKHGQPGYFQTRYLDPTAKANAAMVAEALERAEREGMLEQALQAERDHQAERQRQADQEAVEKLARGLERLDERQPDLAHMLRGILDRLPAEKQADAYRAIAYG